METIHQIVPITIFETFLPVQDSWLEYALDSSYHKRTFEANEPGDDGTFTENKFVLDDLPDLKLLILQKFEFYIRDYFKIKKNISFDFINSWINFHPPKHSCHLHNHCNSIFSGVYYLLNDTNMGDIIFHTDPFDNNIAKGFELEFDEWTNWNCYSYKISPKSGTLIIFPSYLKHSVNKNITDVNRFSLAFNLFFKNSKWGKESNQIEI